MFRRKSYTISVIGKEDLQYPERLRQISGAPKQLYYKGVWNEGLFENCLAVVGSRRMTSYGKRATEQIVGEVAAAGVTIVSGFMYGVDAAAHKAALRAGGRTIAVMPCGIERIHPEYQEDLYKEILENGGLVLSEWEGDMMPANWSYPMRNKIVAGLCRGTLIVEAGENSGSLITANLAKKFGRKLFAVPGPVTSSVSSGTNQLIQQGAQLVTSGKEILEYYGIQKGGLPLKKSTGEKARGVEKKVIEQLRSEPLAIDELARTLGLSVSQLGTTLSIMEIQGFVTQENGRYYANNF